MNPMLEALRRKKAQPVEIVLKLDASPSEGMHSQEGEPVEPDSSIMGEEQEDKDEARTLDQAPEATELGEANRDKDIALGHIGHHDNMTPGAEMINHPDAEQDKSLIEDELSKAHLGKQSIMARHKIRKGMK